MKNLFANTTSPDLLKPGKYHVELVSISPGKDRAYDNKKPKPTLNFLFRETTSGLSIHRIVTATRDPRGRLIEFVRQLSGEKQPTQEQITSGESLTLFLDTLIGKKFDAVIETSENGRYNNIVSIYPLRIREGR